MFGEYLYRSKYREEGNLLLTFARHSTALFRSAWTARRSMPYLVTPRSTQLELSASQRESCSVTDGFPPSAQNTFVQTIIFVTASPLASQQGAFRFIRN
jgi:hypothetical protein